MSVPVTLFLVVCFAVIGALILDAGELISLRPWWRAALTLIFLACVVVAVAELLVLLSAGLNL